ncbi:MAG: transglutaminase domain-containing protein [Lachnospiraceae bacterium]|nr:transglutaminase domain-containing protein [Lachnospiraceae bacterium]
MKDRENINNDNLENDELEDEDLEIEFVDNDFADQDIEANHNNSDGTIELEEVTDDEDDYENDGYNEITDDNDEYVDGDDEDDEFDEDDIEYNPDADYNGEDIKQKLTKSQIVNRVIAGMGIAIAAFTIFYGAVAYGMLNKDDTQATETETTPVAEEETKAPGENEFFVSTNSDENISDDVKDLLNDAKLDETKTGHSKLDDNANNILKMTTKSDMNTYENVRNIYDYMMYFYDVKSNSFVDDDTVYDFCSNYEFTSSFDMELMYRANKLFETKSGDSKDYACGFTVLLRRLGLEAYYIDGERKTETSYENRGYTLVVINGKQYIFDVAAEDELSAGAKVEYKVFCKTLDELKDSYSDDGIKESMDKFEDFKTLGAFSFNTKISTSSGDSDSGSVSYSGSDNSTSVGDMTIDVSDTVYFKGSVSGSKSNTWKLIAKVYDKNMNYVTEETLYSESNDETTDEVSYRPARSGYVKLSYIVTDNNGRTCSISVMLKVNGYDEPETTKNEPTTEHIASSGEIE